MAVLKGTVPSTITTTTSEEQGGSTSSISSLHRDIVESHILPKLDGATLASTSSSSSSFHHLCSQDYLWLKACITTWPSTSTPLVRELISNSTKGPQAFFSQSYPLPRYQIMFPTNKSQVISNSKGLLTPPPKELISAVDITFKENVIFSKVQETETETGWFRCSHFRVDLLEPKDVVTTLISHPESDDKCKTLMEDMSLSWIVIDPIQRRAVNLSSHKPVSINRHWLTGEVEVKFVTIHEVPTSAYVQCKVVVTCCRGESGEMQVREVSMEMEDIEGANMYGKESLVVLQRALMGKREKGNLRADDARRKYEEFLEMKERRKEMKLKIEGTLDVLSVGFGVSVIVVFLWFILCG